MCNSVCVKYFKIVQSMWIFTKFTLSHIVKHKVEAKILQSHRFDAGFISNELLILII
jgi:hypothetical protein